MHRPYRGRSATDRVQERRQRLLEAGLEEFGTKGAVATGVKDLCRRAGVSDRYFYESFADSGELLMAVFDQTHQHLLGVTATAVTTAPREPSAQARAAVEAYVRALAGDPRLARIVFVELPAAGRDAERHMRAALRSFARLLEAAARPFLPAGFAEERLRLGALSLIGAIDRVMIEWHDGELDLALERLVEHLVEMLLAAAQIAGVPQETTDHP